MYAAGRLWLTGAELTPKGSTEEIFSLGQLFFSLNLQGAPWGPQGEGPGGPTRDPSVPHQASPPLVVKLENEKKGISNFCGGF